MEFAINYWSVLVAAIAAWLVGGIWYSPALFANLWLKAMGKKKEEVKGASKAMGAGFLLTLVTSYVLAHFVQAGGALNATEGMQIAFWAWLGFMFARSAMTSVFESRSWTLFWIGTFHDLAALLAMGAVLGYWQ